MHEVPQEYLDFIIMVRAGMSVPRALAFNFLSACTSFLGAIIVLASGSSLSTNFQGYLIMYGTGKLTIFSINIHAAFVHFFLYMLFFKTVLFILIYMLAFHVDTSWKLIYLPLPGNQII